MTDIHNRIALFKSAREVIKADHACRNAGIHATVVPVPQTLSSECGMCLVIPSEELALFHQIMQTISLTPNLYEQSVI